MTALTLSVPDIHCGHCKSSIESAVGDLTGIGRVEVEIEAATVDVDFDEEVVTLGSIVEVIESQGYFVQA